MLCRVFAVVLVLACTSSLAHAAGRYDSIKDRLEDKYGDDHCSKATPFLESTRLSCISCAIEKIGGARPSTKFLSLLAVHAQRSVNLGISTDSTGNKVKHGHSSRGGDPNAALLQRVIKEVQAYGACTATPAYDDIPVTPIKDLVYRAVSGSTSIRIPRKENGVTVGYENSVGYNSDEQRELAKFYGFKKFRDIDDLLDDDGFEASSPARRQAGFVERSRESMYNDDSTGAGLKQCINNIGDNRRQNTAFNTRFESDNADLCYFMAMECGDKLGDDISFCDSAQASVSPSFPRAPAPTSVPIIREVTPGRGVR